MWPRKRMEDKYNAFMLVVCMLGISVSEGRGTCLNWTNGEAIALNIWSLFGIRQVKKSDGGVCNLELSSSFLDFHCGNLFAIFAPLLDSIPLIFSLHMSRGDSKFGFSEQSLTTLEENGNMRIGTLESNSKAIREIKVTTMEKEHIWSTIQRCDRCYDKTQEMEMQAVESIEKWRHDQEKAYDKEQAKRERHLNKQKIKVDRQHSKIAILKKDKEVNKEKLMDREETIKDLQ